MSEAYERLIVDIQDVVKRLNEGRISTRKAKILYWKYHRDSLLICRGLNDQMENLRNHIIAVDNYMAQKAGGHAKPSTLEPLLTKIKKWY